jgi:hypothetical protein
LTLPLSNLARPPAECSSGACRGEQLGQIAFLHQTDVICGNASSPSPV